MYLWPVFVFLVHCISFNCLKTYITDRPWNTNHYHSYIYYYKSTTKPRENVLTKRQVYGGHYSQNR